MCKDCLGCAKHSSTSYSVLFFLNVVISALNIPWCLFHCLKFLILDWKFLLHSEIWRCPLWCAVSCCSSYCYCHHHRLLLHCLLSESLYRAVLATRHILLCVLRHFVLWLAVSYSSLVTVVTCACYVSSTQRRLCGVFSVVAVVGVDRLAFVLVSVIRFTLHATHTPELATCVIDSFVVCFVNVVISCCGLNTA